MKGHAPRPDFGPIFRRGEQIALAIIISVSLLVMIGTGVRQAIRSQGVLEIDSTTRRPALFQVDLNRARWPELTLIPGIGERLAKRIVKARETRGRFTSIDQLDDVRGIGPKTIARIRPYCRPLVADKGLADSKKREETRKQPLKHGP